MRVLSLGGGVQSSAMLLMALEGRWADRPDFAVFANTGWESEGTNEWLPFLRGLAGDFPIHDVSNGNIREDTLKGLSNGRRFAAVPFFVQNADGTAGMGRRQCTDEYKLRPIRRSIGLHLAFAGEDVAECWIGISKDEADRQKPSQVGYIRNRYPLLELGLSREECQAYLLARTGRKAPKSGCPLCPYQSDAMHAERKATRPEEHEAVCRVDDAIRFQPGMRGEQYIHRSLVPLREISEFKHEKQGRMFFDQFGNECEGMCGL